MTEINPEALRSAIQERIQLAEAATPGPWTAKLDYPQTVTSPAWLEAHRDGEALTVADSDVWLFSTTLSNRPAEDAAFIAAHDPSFMLRVYRQWLDVLDRHRHAGDEPLCSWCWDAHEDVEDWRPWPCPEVRSVAAALVLNEED